MKFSYLEASLYKLFKITFLVYALIGINAHAQVIATIGMGDVELIDTANAGTSNSAVQEEVRQEIADGLLKTRKFLVLENAELKQRLDRQGLSLSGFYGKSYNSTELLQSGLDYILTAKFDESRVFTQNLGDTRVRVGRVAMTFNFYGVADTTDDFEFRVSTTANVKELAGLSSSDNDALNAAKSEAYDIFVRKVTAELLPIRLMKIDEETSVITLNYGAGVLQKGDFILVYPKDAELGLDETGKPMGESVAMLKVIDAQTKFATAQAITGFQNIEKAQKGLLAVDEALSRNPLDLVK